MLQQGYSNSKDNNTLMSLISKLNVFLAAESENIHKPHVFYNFVANKFYGPLNKRIDLESGSFFIKTGSTLTNLVDLRDYKPNLDIARVEEQNTFDNPFMGRTQKTSSIYDKYTNPSKKDN